MGTAACSKHLRGRMQWMRDRSPQVADNVPGESQMSCHGAAGIVDYSLVSIERAKVRVCMRGLQPFIPLSRTLNILEEATMGAGVPQRIINGRIYRLLRKQQAELDAAGVCSTYSKLTLSGHDERNPKATWKIHYNTAHLSNGETWGLPQVELSQEAAQKSWFLHYNHRNRFMLDVPKNVCQRRTVHRGQVRQQ